MLNLSILAVRHLREENGVLTLGVKVLLVAWVGEVVLARARIFFARKVVVASLVGLE
jgi:hypothetical protein